MPLSSSTMSMLACISILPVFHRPFSLCGGAACLCWHGRHFHCRESNQESRAYGQIVFHANGPVVLGDDPARNRQSQSRPALFGREMRKEKPLLVLGRNSV